MTTVSEPVTTRQKGLILAGLLTALFLSSLDGTIVATAQPAIVRQFQAINLISWVTTAYLLANTALVPIMGKLSDLYGRRVVIMTSTLLFLIGSAFSGAAGSMGQLIAARVLQGAGAAGITAIAFAIIADLWVPAERARISGLTATVFGLSGVVGPLAGGWLTDHLSWRYAFYINLPIGALALVLIAWTMPKRTRTLKAVVDWPGVLLLVTSVVPFLLALSLDKSVHAWTSPLILGLFATAAAAFALFLVVEARAASPLLPLPLFKDRTMAVVSATSFLFGGAYFGSLIYLAIFMVGVAGVSATKAGSALLPMMGGMVVGAILSTNLAQKMGRYKPFLLIGLLATGAGLYAMSTMTADTTLAGVTWRMVVIGVGCGPVSPLLSLAITNAAPADQMGVATSVRNFFQSIGQTLATAIFGVILTTNLTGQINAHFEPIKAELPAGYASRFDVNQMKSSMGGGSSLDVDSAITGEIRKQFGAMRDTMTRAIRDGDPAAREGLTQNPLIPDPLKQMLTQIEALEAKGPEAAAPAKEAALKAALAAIDQSEAKAMAQGQAIGEKIGRAVKESLAGAITPLYFQATFIALLAFLVALRLPEIPLRKRQPDGSAESEYA